MKQYICILFLSLLSIINLQSQEGILYTLKDGLSNSLINEICQDNNGFIWIATDYGLNRFDGINFKTFNLGNNNHQLISTNKFNATCFDKEDRLLVGTEKGLYYFDQNNESFNLIHIPEVPELSLNQISNITIDNHYNIWLSISGLGVVCINRDSDNQYSLKSKHFRRELYDVSCIFQASDGSIWIGTRSHGAFKISPDSISISQYHAQAEEELAIVGNCVYTIAEDQNKNIIIGVFGSGISLISPAKSQNKQLTLTPGSAKSLICHILVDSNNRIIVGIDGDGLHILDTVSMQLIPFVSSIQSINIKKAKIHKIFEDKFQNIWIAAHQKGLVAIPKESKLYEFIGHDPYNNNFPNNSILSITQDKHKNLWIGTDGGGLVQYELESKDLKVHARNTSNYFPDNIILSTYCDDNILWIGTYLSGAIKMDIKTGKQTQFTHNPLKNSIRSNYINAITLDKNKRVWFGTGDAGVCCIDIDGTFKNLYEYTNQNYNISFVYSLYCDSNNKLWISAKNGIFTVDVKNKILDNLPSLNRALANSAIYSVREDENGLMWLSNINGLVCYNPVTADVKILNPQNSNAGNNIVNAIEIDTEGNIWGSSNTGIFQYQPQTGISNHFPAYIGLPNNEFNPGVSFRNNQSEIFFGGLTGISHFSLSKSRIKREIQQVYFTELGIHNKTVKVQNSKDVTNDVLLDKSIIKVDSIQLMHDQNHFLIQFAAIEYAFPDRVRYKYMLEGYEKEWKETNSKNNAVYYRNIEPGKYIFKVMASFDPLFENYTENSLTIIIAPPMWLTWWAKTLYVILALLLISFFLWLMIRRIETKQELLREKQTADILEAQLDSFTNMSHEIRTPLTIIVGLLRRLMKGKEKNTERAYRMMMDNSEKILKLTNQLLDVHMLDAGVMRLKFDYIDIVDYTEEIVESFRPLAAESEMFISFDSDMETLDAIIDPEAFSKIVYNLLSNAIKYAKRDDQIKVKLTWSNDISFKLIIEDTGMGIPDDKLDKIFERFYKDEENTSAAQGIGIGLHLTKSLVELMHGDISVSSKIGEGTTFSVILPIVGQNSEDIPSVIEYTDQAPSKDLDLNKKTNYLIALVEDDEDISDFISEELNNYYKTIKFPEATSAYEYISNNKVDLIISDVMMPGMDGFEFCNKIKSNPETELIPLILLTAKSDHQSLIRGAGEGADAYITKPFVMEILIAKINNLIKVRKTMSTKYSLNYEVGTIDKIDQYKSPDDKLIERFMELIKSQIDNPELNIESISAELGISRANLYRKIKNKTNQTPSNFIRDIRLNQAAILLKKNIPVSEVAYAVGFNSHSYFSKSFLEHFGCSPSEYITKNN